MTIELRSYNLLGNLNDEEDVLDRFTDEMGNDSYVGDMISEVADNQVPIYYGDIWEGARDIEEYIGEAIAQGLYDVTNSRDFDLHRLFQAGYYEYYTQSLYRNLDEMVFNMVAHHVNDFLNGLNEEDVVRVELDEIEERIESFSENFDNNKRISDIMDEANDIISDIEDELEAEEDDEEDEE